MNLRALWLLFAQATVVFMAAAFVAAGFWRLFMSPSSYSAAIARVMPSVVSIYGRDGGEINSVGAGIIVSHDGDILTNYHLVADRETVEVELGGKERHIATIAGIDPEIDLAVLRISTSTKLPAISFADNTPPAPGDIVFAVGNPFGLNNSASMGIISAVKRNKLGINRPGQEQFIQTDAAINPGSSGGALANTDGELVGINTALFSRRRSGDSPQGISFAVPVAAIHRSYLALIQTALPEEDNIFGAEVRPLPSRLLAEIERMPRPTTSPTVLISKIWKDSIAAQNGLLVGDIVLAMEGANAEQAAKIGHLPSDTQRLHVLRNGEKITLELSRKN